MILLNHNFHKENQKAGGDFSTARQERGKKYNTIKRKGERKRKRKKKAKQRLQRNEK